MIENSKPYKVFTVVNSIIVSLLALLCFLPILNVFAISLSDRTATSAGMVSFIPINFTLEAYKYVMQDSGFLKALAISVFRVAVGGSLNLLLTVLCAYPLSKSSEEFQARKVYVWFFLFATLFNGGLIPTYMVVRNTGLLNTVWSLILPGAVPVFHVILMLNFFRGLPKEIEEAALIDGAGHWTILARIYVPLSKASIATVTLFSLVAHWNSWFDGMIYMSNTARQPLATFLHNQVVKSGVDMMMNTSDMDTLKQMLTISDQTTKAAQIFLGMLPILLVYPFLQKYFTKGVTVGSVKG